MFPNYMSVCTGLRTKVVCFRFATVYTFVERMQSASTARKEPGVINNPSTFVVGDVQNLLLPVAVLVKLVEGSIFTAILSL